MANILVKPIGENSGRLVILADNTSSMTLVDITTGEVIEQGRNSGASNGRQATFRFERPGGAYQNIGLMDDRGNILLTMPHAGDRVQFNYEDYDALVRTPVSTIPGYRWSNEANLSAQAQGRPSNQDIAKMTPEEYEGFMQSQGGGGTSSSGGGIGSSAIGVGAAAAPFIADKIMGSAAAETLLPHMVDPLTVSTQVPASTFANPNAVSVFGTPLAGSGEVTSLGTNTWGNFGSGGTAPMLADTAGVAVAAHNTMDAIGNLQGDRKGVTEGLANMAGTTVGAIFGGPVGAGVGSVVGRTVGRGLNSALKAAGVEGWRKSTKEKHEDRWKYLADKGVDVSGAYRPHHGTGTWESGKYAGQSWTFEKAKDLAMEDPTGFQKEWGNYDVMGNQWNELSDMQQKAIVSQWLENDLYESKDGAVRLKDNVQAKQIADAVISGQIQVAPKPTWGTHQQQGAQGVVPGQNAPPPPVEAGQNPIIPPANQGDVPITNLPQQAFSEQAKLPNLKASDMTNPVSSVVKAQEYLTREPEGQFAPMARSVLSAYERAQSNPERYGSVFTPEGQYVPWSTGGSRISMEAMANRSPSSNPVIPPPPQAFNSSGINTRNVVTPPPAQPPASQSQIPVTARAMVPSGSDVNPPITGFSQTDGALLAQQEMEEFQKKMAALSYLQSGQSNPMAQNIMAQAFQPVERKGVQNFSQLQGAF